MWYTCEDYTVLEIFREKNLKVYIYISKMLFKNFLLTIMGCSGYYREDTVDLWSVLNKSNSQLLYSSNMYVEILKENCFHWQDEIFVQRLSEQCPVKSPSSPPCHLSLCRSSQSPSGHRQRYKHYNHQQQIVQGSVTRWQLLQGSLYMIIDVCVFEHCIHLGFLISIHPCMVALDSITSHCE